MDQNDRFNGAFYQSHIKGFCTLQGEGLVLLKEDLSLQMSESILRFLQRYFAQREHREPTVSELLFLDEYTAAARFAPDTVLLSPKIDDPALQRCHQDILRQRAALGEEKAPDLAALLNTCGRYLTRAGIPPREERFVLESELDLLCQAAKASPVISLKTDTCCAAQLSNLPTRKDTPSGIILSLRATPERTLSETALRFFALFEKYNPCLLATVGGEGLAPHLRRLPVGILLDVQPLAGYDPDASLWQAMLLLRDTVLITVPREAVPLILQSGAPAVPVGSVTNERRVVIRAGASQLLSLSLAMLGQLHSTKPLPLTVKPLSGDAVKPSISLREDLLMAAVSVTAGVLPSCLSMLYSALSQGAKARTMTLCAALSLSAQPTTAALADTTALALDLHRFCAALSIPSTGSRVLIADSDAPTLTVFLWARRGDSPDEERLAALRGALAAGDFAALREALYR